MTRERIFLLLAFFAFATISVSAQTFLNEDFSTGTGTTAPTGWTTSTSGGLPASWRWDNPGLRTFDSGFTAPFAILDSDNAGSSVTGASILTSPTFNATGTTLLNLTFDTQFRALQTTGDFAQVEIFDGTAWNVVSNYIANVGYLAPNLDTTAPAAFDVTAASGGSANAQLRFNHGYGWDWWWAIDNVKIEQPSAIDLAIISIDSPIEDPNACLPVTGNLNVVITIENQGALPVLSGTLIPLQFDINGGVPSFDFLLLASDLNPTDTLQFTFTNQANLLAPGPNNLTVNVSLLGDGDPTDDSASQSYAGVGGTSLVSIFPYLESFDSITTIDSTTPPALWRQEIADGTGTGSDWFFRTGSTGTVGTGPIGDHTSGNGTYAYIEDAYNFAQTSLVSPCFDTSFLVNPELRFWLHSQNGSSPTTSFENFFSVDVVSYPGGLVTMDVLGPLGHQGANWGAQTINLAPFAGQVVQFIFRGQSNAGGASHDIAIDDVAVYDPQPTPGQAPQPGTAVLDINGAINVNASPVSLAAGGPYFTAIATGTNMAIQITGEPNSPIAFLAGPLTPVAATYPNVGQLDIGGAVNPMTGIPGSIVVIGDGFNPNTFINAIFNTGPAAQLYLGLQLPPLPAGPLATFQALTSTTNGFFFAISNAVEVTVM